MSSSELEALISSAYSLALLGISEPGPGLNSLEIVVQEVAVNKSRTVPAMVGVAGFEHLLAHPIEPMLGCRTYSFFWELYAAYLVTEEMVGSCGKEQQSVLTGRHVGNVSESEFLGFLGKVTGAHSKPLQHYRINTLNHLIDVATYDAPIIKLLSTL